MNTLRSQPLIEKFISLKNDVISDALSWQKHSEQVQVISSILHKFYLDDLEKVNNYQIIEELINLGVAKLTLGHTIELNQKLELIYFNLITTQNISLYTPNQIVALLQEDWSDNEQNLIELYLSQSDTWLAINLGIYLKSI